VIIAGASPVETKMWAVVRETAIFCTCGSNNWETVEDRGVHAARGLASTELSFHSCNVLRDCHRGVSREELNCGNLIIHNIAGFSSLRLSVTGKLAVFSRI